MVSKFLEKEEPGLRERLAVKQRRVHRRFDLSQHKFLRTLEITAKSIPRADALYVGKSELLRVSDFLTTVISSVAPSVSLDLVVTYRDVGYDGAPCLWKSRCRRHDCMSGLRMNEGIFEEQLEVIRKMHSVRSFRLVLCVDNLDCIVDEGVRLMGEIVKAVKAKGGFDFLHCEPLMVCERRTLRTRAEDYFGLGKSGSAL
jgi:hypothetical protein